MRFSVVTPIFNEEENIPELYRRLRDVLEDLCRSEGDSTDSFEILFVDDGSSDRSWSLIQELHASDHRVQGISFSRNFGHHIAVTAGVDHAQGDAIVLMDGDLQDPPEEITKLYSKFKEGYDIVYAVRTKRDDSLMRKFTSWVFLRLLKRISNVEISLESGIFRIISRRCAENLGKMREHSRFIVGLMSWVGFSQTGVDTIRHKRFKGTSKYDLSKLVRLAWHGMTSFSFFPLVVSTYLGFIVAAVSFMMGGYMLIKKIFWGIPLAGYASLIVSLYFLCGVILLMLGLIGEYIGRIMTEVQQRPLYIIKERIS